LAPQLIASGRGRFLLASGAAAQAPTSGNAAYAASKAWAEAWTLAFDAELREHGGAANVLVVKMLTEDRGASKVATHVDDAAAAIAFALSPAAAQMRGQRWALHP
jgi:short-subunit dehydrogenase